MFSIVILAASFITALIGIIRNNRAKPGEKSLCGLNLLGAILLGLSITGATAALVQEIRSSRATDEDKHTITGLSQKLDQSLNIQSEVAQKLDRLAGTVKDPNVKQALTEVSSRLGGWEFKRGEHASIPPWVPIYPGIRPESVQERRDQSGWSGSYDFPANLAYLDPSWLLWYRDRLREAGFTITTIEDLVLRGGRLVARDPSGRRRFTLSQPEPAQARVLWEEQDR